MLGRLGLAFAGKRRAIAEKNVTLCFPELEPTARRHLVQAHGEALGMAAMDFAIAWWWSDKRLAPLIEVEGAGHIEKAVSAGQGVIFLTAHFTSIEISGRLLVKYCNALPMYRPSNNPLLEALMVKNRERHVEQVIPRHDVRLMIRTLKDGKGVWFAPDQNFGAKGRVFAPFFGIPASSNTSLGRFAKMTGAAILPFVVLRRTGQGYRMIVEAPLEHYPSDDPVADATRYNEIVEQWIRQAPAQYNWIHRRFKNQPDGSRTIYKKPRQQTVSR